VKEWNEIPDFIVENFVSSFHARCVVCNRIGGESLNGHWGEVREVHHPGARFAYPPGRGPNDANEKESKETNFFRRVPELK
jgi:hypothetical protein